MANIIRDAFRHANPKAVVGEGLEITPHRIRRPMGLPWLLAAAIDYEIVLHKRTLALIEAPHEVANVLLPFL